MLLKKLTKISMAEDDEKPMFSRKGISALGKCSATLKTHVPDDIDFEFRQAAQMLGCSPSELLRDVVCLAVRGATFGELTAAERRKTLDKGGPEKGLLSSFFSATRR
jgi:hypothetical protein